MIRLKRSGKFNADAFNAHFNSLMIRLKPFVNVTDVGVPSTFQFLNDTIKTATGNIVFTVRKEFQFLNDTIKTSMIKIYDN